jgi:hypothetical protein
MKMRMRSVAVAAFFATSLLFYYSISGLEAVNFAASVQEN